MNQAEHLEKIDARLADIQGAIAEIRMIYAAQSRRIDRLESEIFGNGRVGLATQLRAVLWMLSGALGFLAILAANVISAWLS